MSYNWVSLLGLFEQKKKNEIIFKGKEVEYESKEGPQKGGAIGHYVCDQSFSEGKISASIEFTDVSESLACELMIYYNSRTFLNAGIGTDRFAMFSIRFFNNGKWNVLASSGDGENLKPNTKYDTLVSVTGSRIVLTINGVNVCFADLPISLPVAQAGIWCIGKSDMRIKDYSIKTNAFKVFVIMQYSSPYNELYEEVITKICAEFKLRVERADETYGPGIIIADIEKQIRESHIIIAEISPINANVYYEVGFAHALQKPTILIADTNTKLPFDVSPFRTLFYENSIGGKKKIEEGLRKHLEAILNRDP